MTNLKKHKRINLREYECILKKLAEPQGAGHTSVSDGNHKLQGAWLGEPSKRTATQTGDLEPIGRETVPGKHDEPSLGDKQVMDFETFKGKMGSSSQPNIEKGVKSTPSGWAQAGEPAEMVYFPQNSNEPLPISLSNLKKGASASEM